MASGTDALQFKPAQAAHARKCMHRETATEPSTGSTPEFWKTEQQGPVRLRVADERRGRNSPRRSLSPRSCARHDSHPCGRVGAIAGKHSAQAPTEIPWRRKSQQMRVQDFLNVRICSSRSELVTTSPAAQANFGRERPSFVETMSGYLVTLV